MDTGDYKKFLIILKKCAKKFNWKIHHYVLMPNHYHLILHNKVPKELSAGVKVLNLLYVNYFRRKYGGVGHLWQDRFKSFVIESKFYLLQCGRYIELNPVKANMVTRPEEYQWSSYHFYAYGREDMLVSPSPEYLGLAESQEMRQKLYRDFVQDGLKEKRGLERYFRAGYLGSDEFGDKLKLEGLKFRNWKTGPKGP